MPGEGSNCLGLRTQHQIECDDVRDHQHGHVDDRDRIRGTQLPRHDHRSLEEKPPAPKAGVREERLTLSMNMKGLAPFWTKAKYGKMSIEGRDLVDTQTSHHSETRAIHDGKILVAPGSAKVPRNLKVRQSNRLDHCYPAPQAFPKSLRSFAVKLVVKQRPCFDQHTIRGHQCFTGLENCF